MRHFSLLSLLRELRFCSLRLTRTADESVNAVEAEERLQFPAIFATSEGESFDA
jgi:hypothetical protein